MRYGPAGVQKPTSSLETSPFFLLSTVSIIHLVQLLHLPCVSMNIFMSRTTFLWRSSMDGRINSNSSSENC